MLPAGKRQSVHVLSADAGVKRPGSDSSVSGYIAQIFSRAINIHLNQDRDIYSLLSITCDNAPNSCRLALTHCNTHFHTGEQVWFHQHYIDIGHNKRLDFSYCQPWKPMVLQLNSALNERIHWQKIAEQMYQTCRYSNSLFYYRGDNIFYREMARQLNKHRTKLINALSNNNSHDIYHAVISLLGLGIGLTPSGDDYLVGICTILFTKGHPGNRYHPLFLIALKNAEEKTNLLSTITLKEAVNCRYREVIYRLISQIINSEHQNIFQTINQIKNIGSSSGCDMLCGMADACSLTIYPGGEDVVINSN